MVTDSTLTIGVDGGGTGCRAAIAAPDGRVIGTASAGPANATTDFDGAVSNVTAALSAATEKAGLRLADLYDAPAHVGLAGIMSDADAARCVTELPFARVSVSDDRATSVTGGLGGKDGLLAAIGTGSFIGASAAGDMRFVGGWGLKVGDQASGAWLGRSLLEHVLLAHDGLADGSPLTDTVFDKFQRQPDKLVLFARDAAPADFATFAPRIVEAAEAGDPVGTELMTKGATYLTRAIALLDPGPATAIVLSGGLGPRYRTWIEPAYATRLQDPAGTALDGALLLARRA